MKNFLNVLVFVAMSGGVDSSCAAAILKEAGHHIEGVFMRNWSDEEGACSSERDWQAVQDVCRHLNIRCHKIDLSRQYWIKVFEPTLDFYAHGKTPNPDVWCNQQIKFGELMDALEERSAQTPWKIATGHYASVKIDEATGEGQLCRPVDDTKDQTHFLCTVGGERLANVLFPLHGLKKKDVRQRAKHYKLPTANRQESQGLCFVSSQVSRGDARRAPSLNQDNSFHNLITSHLSPKQGRILDVQGCHVGNHQGLWHATIGQRSRTCMPQPHDGSSHRYYVASKDIDKNTLTIALRNDPVMWKVNTTVDSWKPINPRRWDALDDAGASGSWVEQAFAQYRHLQPPQLCRFRRRKEQTFDNQIEIEFKSPQWALAAGQVLSLWDTNGVCYGGGHLT